MANLMYLLLVSLLGFSCISLLSCCDAPDLLGDPSYTRERRSAPVEVKKRQPKLRLYFRTTPPETVAVGMTDDHVLECKAGGFPVPVVTWLKDGVEVDQRDHAQKSSNGNKDPVIIPGGLGSTISRLYIDCMMLQDEGEYTCVATSPYLRNTSDTRVTMARIHPTKPVNPICASRDRVSSGNIPLPVKRSPRIYLHSTRIMEAMGKDALLMCRHSGDVTLVRWTKDEEKLPGVARTTVLRNGDLLIRNLVWSDLGVYKCEVINEYGSCSITTFLYPMAESSKDKQDVAEF